MEFEEAPEADFDIDTLDPTSCRATAELVPTDIGIGVSIVFQLTVRCTIRGVRGSGETVTIGRRRTEDDIAAVRRTLQRVFPGAVVPPVAWPDRVTKGYYTEQQTKSMLETDMNAFLEICLAHPDFSQQEQFRALVLATDAAWKTKRRESMLGMDAVLGDASFMFRKAMGSISKPHGENGASNEDEQSARISFQPPDAQSIKRFEEYLQESSQLLAKLIENSASQLEKLKLSQSEQAISSSFNPISRETDHSRRFTFAETIESLLRLRPEAPVPPSAGVSSIHDSMAAFLASSSSSSLSLLDDRLTALTTSQTGQSTMILLLAHVEAKRCLRWVEAALDALRSREICLQKLDDASNKLEDVTKSVAERGKLESAKSEMEATKKKEMSGQALFQGAMKHFYGISAASHSTSADLDRQTKLVEQATLNFESADRRSLLDVGQTCTAIKRAVEQMVLRHVEFERVRAQSLADSISGLKLDKPMPTTGEAAKDIPLLLRAIAAPADEALYDVA
eukprot:CAMPEP_0118965492 /NCGR_PEP_ID=MMETSP1173-20130426/3058_1 /TAXON_ID=1034831 /ORGANISM="Rhizochromulina marina cf, Strain CCMP1243" /LENGTH=508 /DNA_ID=CAMNT_0006914125 /DNA_START=21 /DNA_END=1547 /DNA_ORIENTATION=-